MFCMILTSVDDWDGLFSATHSIWTRHDRKESKPVAWDHRLEASRSLDTMDIFRNTAIGIHKVMFGMYMYLSD